MRNVSTTLLLALTLCFGACSKDADKAGNGNGAAASNASAKEGDATPAKAVRYEAKCGCSIEGIGRCGNYVMIEGKYVPIVHSSLGKMEWCSKKAKGATIEAVGEMKDGTFVASSVKTIE